MDQSEREELCAVLVGELPTALATLLGEAGPHIGRPIRVSRSLRPDTLASSPLPPDLLVMVVGRVSGLGPNDVAALRAAWLDVPLLTLLEHDGEDNTLTILQAGADESLSLGAVNPASLAYAVRRAIARHGGPGRHVAKPRSDERSDGSFGTFAPSLRSMHARMVLVDRRLVELEATATSMDVAALGLHIDERPSMVSALVQSQLHRLLRQRWEQLARQTLEMVDQAHGAAEIQGAEETWPRRPSWWSGGWGEGIAGERPRVLAVDDDSMILLAIVELLASHMDVVAAHGGERAIEILEVDEAFDAIVCDVSMPGVDGIAVLDYIRSRRPELVHRFVFCTSGVHDPAMACAVMEADRPVVPKSSLSLLGETLDQIVLSARPQRCASRYSE